MISNAYWISPKNEIIEVSTNHIDVVIKNPEKFGLTKDYIEDVYLRYGEAMGVEGKAREEIILDLIRKGWIRIRRYKNRQWSFNVKQLSKKIKDQIFDWSVKVSSKEGLFGQQEKDLYMPVNIVSTLDNSVENLTVKDVMSGALYEHYEKYDNEVSLIECKLKDSKITSWVNYL